MNRGELAIKLILPLVKRARRIIGEDAVKIANDIPGLEVTADEGIEVTGDGIVIYEKLLKAYNEKLHGNLVLELKAEFHVYRTGQHGREAGITDG